MVNKDNVVSLKPKKQQGRIPTSEFIVPTQDTKGHSARIGCRIPPAMIHQVEKIIGTRQFPWDTQSDFLRWCVFKGINAAAELVDNPRVDNTMGQINAMVAILREEEEATTFVGVIERAEKVIGSLISQGATVPAKRTVNQLLEHIDQMDDKYWKNKFKKEVERRFGHVLIPQGEK